MSIKKLSVDFRTDLQHEVDYERGVTQALQDGDENYSPRSEEEAKEHRLVLETREAALNDTTWWETSNAEPVLLSEEFCFTVGWEMEGPEVRYLFHNVVYGITGKLTGEQAKLLVQEEFDAERRKFERLKHKFSGVRSVETDSGRERIPEEVRIVVWRRDDGRCVRCGSRERLEYDHIIPVSRGGSNTVRNIELLCESCNRSKKDHIQ